MRCLITGTVFISSVVWGATGTKAATVAQQSGAGSGAMPCLVHCMNLDTWDDVLENLRLLCLVLGCAVERVSVAESQEQVEHAGWNVVVSYITNGLREDLTLAERQQGASAARDLLAQLEQTPSLVSEELRPQLLGVTQSIVEEVLP